MFSDRIGALDAIRRRYGSIAFVKLGPFSLVLITDPELAREILQDTDRFPQKAIGLREAGHLLGNGLLTSAGKQWELGRNAVSPLFVRSEIDALLGEVDEQISSVIGEIPKTTDPVEVLRLADRITFAGTANWIFGRPISCSPDPVLDDFQIFSRWVGRQIALPIPCLTPIRWALAVRPRAARNRLRNFVLQRLDPNTKLGRLLSEAGLSDREVDETLTFLLAGYETTSSAVAWTLDLLSRNPEAAEAVAREAHTLKSATVADLHELKITKAAVQEAIRLYPPVWALTRTAVEGTSLGGYRIPDGANVLINVYGLHRDVTCWDRSDQFQPDRFTRPSQNKGTYLPFGAGPRQCIGLQSGLLEVTLIVARILSQFRLEPTHSQTGLSTSLTLRPDFNHTIRFLLRAET
jgi:cytochrome P450